MILVSHPKKGTILKNGYEVKEILKKSIPFSNRFRYELLLENEKGMRRKALYLPRKKEVCRFSKSSSGCDTHYLSW
jgi:hypothetical protein